MIDSTRRNVLASLVGVVASAFVLPFKGFAETKNKTETETDTDCVLDVTATQTKHTRRWGAKERMFRSDGWWLKGQRGEIIEVGKSPPRWVDWTEGVEDDQDHLLCGTDEEKIFMATISWDESQGDVYWSIFGKGESYTRKEQFVSTDRIREIQKNLTDELTQKTIDWLYSQWESRKV